MYLDTCIEPWPGGYTDPTVPPAAAPITCCARRRWHCGPAMRAPHRGAHTRRQPGLVSHFVKQALLNIAADTKVEAGKPATRAEWSELARRLSVKVIHIAERDTQVSGKPKQLGEFVNTWSIDGFVGEGSQPSEMGWAHTSATFRATASVMTPAAWRRST